MTKRTLLCALFLFLFPASASAAPRPDTTCGWGGTVLWAENLPDDWALVFSFHPTGVGEPGFTSYRVDWGEARDAWFITRNGPGMKDAPKFGPQLNDYKVVCIAEAS